MLGFGAISELPISGLPAGGGSVAYTLSGAAGAYSLNGNAGAFSYVPGSGSVAYSLSGAAGSYTITGRAATFKVGRLLSGAAGSYVITGNAGTLSYVPGSGSVAYSLSGAAGSYTITGRAATFKVGRLLSGAAGVYQITGGEGSFAWSGASTSVGGGGSGKKYYAKVGKKLLVFKTRQGAIDALDSEEDEPEVEISLPAVKAYAKVTGQIDDYNAAYRSEQYAKLLAMFEQMRYDEDVELLMLS